MTMLDVRDTISDYIKTVNSYNCIILRCRHKNYDKINEMCIISSVFTNHLGAL